MMDYRKELKEMNVRELRETGRILKNALRKEFKIKEQLIGVILESLGTG